MNRTIDMFPHYRCDSSHPTDYYDCENRLIDVNDANDAPVASYTYDYLGRRISRTIYGSPDVTIKYAYDGDRIIAEYDANDTLLRKFIYAPASMSRYV